MHRNIKEIYIIFDMFGTPGEIRTPDPLVRSQVLYPAELRAHEKNIYYKRIECNFGKNLRLIIAIG